MPLTSVTMLGGMAFWISYTSYERTEMRRDDVLTRVDGIVDRNKLKDVTYYERESERERERERGEREREREREGGRKRRGGEKEREREGGREGRRERQRERREWRWMIKPVLPSSPPPT